MHINIQHGKNLKPSYFIRGVSAFMSFRSNPILLILTSAFAWISSCTVGALLLNIAR